MRQFGRGIAISLLFATATNAADAPPRVVAAWAAGPLEARVRFDKAVGPEVAKGLVGTRIVFGDDVKVGDRYVPRKPGDPPAGGPKAETRGSLRIAAARLDDGGRTLILATDPHSRDAVYALHIPTPINLDLVYNLRGIDIIKDNGAPDARPEGSAWWPSFDQAEVPGGLRKTPGRLTLKTLLSAPNGKTTIRATASGPVEISLGNESAKSDGKHPAEVSADVEGGVIDLVLTIGLDGKTPFALGVTDGKGQRLDASKLTLAWAAASPPTAAPTPVPPELLAGGDPAKGAMLFKSEQAKCANCHKVRGEGGDVGPDLSDLVHRDRAWIYRNLAEPSATIHPDYVPYTVLTKDGRVLVGIIRAEGANAIKVIDTDAKTTIIAKAEIEELKPSAASIMPVGLVGAVGESGMKDLLAFLTKK
jgi:putative heme-binding domain-containing protein